MSGLVIGNRVSFNAPLRGVRFGPSTKVTYPTPLRPRAAAVARHLVLAYRPGWQSVEDLNSIADHVRDLDPRIETFIVPTTHRNEVTRRQIARRPTLVVSPGRMPVFKPLRGKVYQGWPIPKIDEVRRMEAAGLPVPRTAILTPGLKLDPAEWGEFVILKPTDIGTSSQGLGINLMRTERVRFVPPSSYPADHPGRLGPMIVQQYVNLGGHVATYRALTLFGETLYIMYQQTRRARLDFRAPDEEIEKSIVAHQSLGDDDKEFSFTEDPDMVALARRAHDAVPEVPLKGIDIVREAATGKLYLLELNCGGNTWHFSSRYAEAGRKKLGPVIDRKRRFQFDAMRTSARVLVERVNAEAE